MITGQMDDNLEQMLDKLSAGLKNPTPLSGPLSQVLFDGNLNGLGTDRDGNPLAPLAASTVKRRKGTGPPLAPQGASSPIVTQARVDANSPGDGVLNVALSWDLPWLQFVGGTKFMPPRDIVGIRPVTLGLVMEELKDYGTKLMGK